jgi:hypothetical protein
MFCDFAIRDLLAHTLLFTEAKLTSLIPNRLRSGLISAFTLSRLAVIPRLLKTLMPSSQFCLGPPIQAALIEKE